LVFGFSFEEIDFVLVMSLFVLNFMLASKSEIEEMILLGGVHLFQHGSLVMKIRDSSKKRFGLCG